MIHNFNCDNCGKAIETYCFDKRDIARFYHTPPVPNTEDVDKRISHLIHSHSTLLCIECVNQ